MTAALSTAPDYAGLVARAFEGARLACGVAASDTYSGYPARVRVLAAVALFRGQYMPARRAAADCAVGDQARLSPSQIERSGVTDGLASAVIEYLRSAAPVAAVPDPRRRASSPAPSRAPGSSAGQDPLRYRAGKREAPTKRTTLRRFASPKIEPSEAIDLRADHPALSEARTIFPTTVVGSRESLGLLVSGHNNPKLGKEVLKGDRAGWPIFHLTLEERATCPRSCPVWAGCYGNAMHQARRHRADADLIRTLKAEVAAKARMYPGGFLVRLHTLGDFYSVEYVLAWAEMLAATPALHVFGYTARHEDDPDAESAKIARAIGILTRAMWKRFAIRTSHGEIGPQRSVVFMADPRRDDVLMCPAQTGATEACATCGLCWAGVPRDKTIGFLKHGMKRGRRGHQPVASDELRNPAGERIPSDQGGARAAEAATGDPPVASVATIEDGSGLKKDGRGSWHGLAVPPANPAPARRADASQAVPPAVRAAILADHDIHAGLAPALRSPRKARRPSVVTDAGRFVRMKPLNDDIIRWSRAYVGRGVEVEYLAGLFDVDGEALGRALEAA